MPSGLESERQELLPRSQRETRGVAAATPGSEVVEQPRPAEHPEDLEGRADREDCLGATRSLREGEGEQRRLAHVVGAVAGEHVVEIVREQEACAEPGTRGIEARHAFVCVPTRLDPTLELEQRHRLESVALEEAEV